VGGALVDIAVEFIRHIATVVVPVAPVFHGDALPVGALELVRTGTASSAVLFVSSIPTVVVGVTDPVGGDAAVVGALEPVTHASPRRTLHSMSVFLL